MLDINEELRQAMAAVESTNPHLSDDNKAGAAFAMLAFRAGYDYANSELTRQEAEAKFFNDIRMMSARSLRMFNQ